MCIYNHIVRTYTFTTFSLFSLQLYWLYLDFIIRLYIIRLSYQILTIEQPNSLKEENSGSIFYLLFIFLMYIQVLIRSILNFLRYLPLTLKSFVLWYIQ